MKKENIVLSQKQRIEIQQKLKKGISVAQIIDFYGIAKSTVSRIKKQVIRQEINLEKKTNKSAKYKELDEQLFKWYQDRKTSEDIPTYELLKKQTKIFTNDVEGPSKPNFCIWLDKFIIRRNIQLEAECHISHKKVDIALINWLLKQIISKNAISDKMLTDETQKFMKEFGGPLKPIGKESWLKNFKICHKILINSIILQTCVERNDETNQSVKNLDEQLLNWLLERKKSGDTISYAMLTEKIFILIDQFDKLSKKMQRESWLFRIKKRYRLRHMFQKTAVVQNVIHRRDNQSNVKKFIQLFCPHLEEENIDAENIYNMIETDVIWKRLIQRFFLLDETKVAKKQIDIENLKKNPLTVIFCTNVTGNNILPPILVTDENEYENQTMSEHCESRLLVPHELQENASIEKSKDFAFWYKLFKIHVKHHQEKKNVTGKVLLLVDDRMQRIFPENITQDTDFEILFLPTNAVSFFESLYPELIAEIDKIFQDDVIKLCKKKSFCEARQFDINFNIIYCITTICKPWSSNTPKDIEKLWRRFLRQDRQIQEDTPTLASTSSQD